MVCLCGWREGGRERAMTMEQQFGGGGNQVYDFSDVVGTQGCSLEIGVGG